MRHESKPSNTIPSTFVANEFSGFMNNNEQNDLTYHRVQQLINDQIDQIDQIDRIEHETDTQSSEEEPRKQGRAKCGIIAKIKRCFRIRCLRFHK